MKFTEQYAQIKEEQVTKKSMKEDEKKFYEIAKVDIEEFHTEEKDVKGFSLNGTAHGGVRFNIKKEAYDKAIAFLRKKGWKEVPGNWGSSYGNDYIKIMKQ